MPRQSARRPTTSQSSRPSTAAEDYAFSTPGTASSSSSPYFTADNPQPLPAALHPHYPNYGYGDDHSTLDGVTEEEEEEESDAEDVFAYLPPSTADIERERQQQGLSPAQLPPRILPHPESPPDTNSSYDHIPQGPDALRMHPLSSHNTDTQNEATPPYAPRSPLVVDQTPVGARQLHVVLPSHVTDSQVAGPSTSNNSSQFWYLPGRAYDNPYEYYLDSEDSAAPSTRASAFTTASDIPSRNLNRGIIRRSVNRGKDPNRRNTIDSLDKDSNIKMEGLSIAKLVGNDVGSLAYSGQSRRMEEGVLDDIDWSTRDGSVKMEYEFDPADEDSPYAEVRASVSNIDDPEMPTLTFRMWLVGLVFTIFAAAFNVIFNFRQPAPVIYPLVILLVSYPFGKFAAYILPISTYRIPVPKRLGGPIEFSLNPGPWNIKEHVLVFMMSNVAITSPFALNATVVGQVFYDIKLGPWFEVTLVLATQMTGMGLAGICRRLLVYPASMVWPNYLVLCTLFNTLHAEDDDLSGGITRYRFFLYVTSGAFVFFWLPGYLFTALSIFSWICWIKPNNVLINQLFGVNSGMGLSTLTFDWSQITWIGSPLMAPWWAEVHIFAGFVLFYWIVVPALYFSNVWNLSYFPMAGSVPFDKDGNVYDVDRVLTPDHRFNETAFSEYSPLYLPATYAVTYILALTLTTCSVVHTFLYHGHTVWKSITRRQVEPPDIHAKFMRAYRETPDWWYLAVFVVFFCVGIISVEVWHTGIPVWALLLSVLLPVIYCVPSGYLYAMTGDPITVNLPAQVIPGILLPGNPMANMVFKAYSVQTLIMSSVFTGDLKLGHYIKIPPRMTFVVQTFAVFLCAFVQVGVKFWMFSNVEGICTTGQKDNFTCPHNEVYFTASAIWGLIGPKRQFGPNSMYSPQLYALLIGAFLPIPFYLWQRRFPKTRLKYINLPIMLNGCQYIPPATGINYSSWFLVAFIFQYVVRRRNFAWWSKFNYIASAALDSGMTIAIFFIFFALQLPKGGIELNWWGNNVYRATMDWNSSANRTIPADGLPPL